MNLHPKRRLGLRIALVLLLLGGLALLLAARTPQGRALLNVADYRLRLAWRGLTGGPGYDPARSGGLAGRVQSGSGEPLPGAVVLVATAEGQVYQARSDGRGRYRIDGVPPGRYVPLAAAWGYVEATGAPVQVVAGRTVGDLDWQLSPYQPAPVQPGDLDIGPSQEAHSDFPSPMRASRTPFRFNLDGRSVDGGQLYLPPEADAPLPTLFVVYPSAPLNWDAASVALTRDGFAVLAIGPDADRGLDIAGHVRDMRAAFQLWQAGRIRSPAQPIALPDPRRWVLMSGSFGSLVVFRGLRDLPPVPALVDVGGVSDAFLAVQSLYSQELAIPPPYDTAIAAMGRPDRDPAFFFALSPIFFAERLPPTLIVHTYADEVIPYNQATALAAALSAAGVAHELLLYEDTTHYLDAYHPTQATHMVYERIVAFAREYVR